MGEGNRGAFLQVVMDVVAIGFRLKFVRHGEHHQVAPGRGLGDAHDLQALAFQSDITRVFAFKMGRDGSGRERGNRDQRISI